MGMDVVSYAVSGKNSGHLGDDLMNLGRGLLGRVSDDESLELRRHYGWGYCRKIVLLIPHDCYCFTRLFVACIACYLARACGRRDWVRAVKEQVNQEAINLSASSVEVTVFQVGWLHPRTGLVLHSTHNILTRTLGLTNRCVRRFWGFPRVEKGLASPIDFSSLRMVLWVRIQRIYYYVKLAFASLLLAAFHRFAPEKLNNQLRRMVRDGGRLLQNKIDIPRYELGMAFSLVAHPLGGFALDELRIRLVEAIRKKF